MSDENPGRIHGSRAVRARVSDRKRSANLRNAQKSTGPRDTQRTRFNAMRHGLRAGGLCTLDSVSEYRSILKQLRAEFQPAGTVENFLMERAALGIIRVRRAGHLEAEHINFHRTDPEGLDATFAESQGRPLRTLFAERVAELADCFGRYEQGHLSMLLRCLRELRELQRERNRTTRPVASFGKDAEDEK